VPGELLIGGAGVGRGYVSQTSLTAERFVADPFRPASGELVYRTGDLCRYRRDGAIEIVGRSDQQIKIRGFRVEPAEIESALIEHCSVRQCAVIDRCDSCGEKQLVAYMVPNDSAATVEDTRLREFLRRKLPDYMVPSVFVHTTELPRTPTGKLDRKALPSPTPITRSRRTDTGLPRTVLEWKLKPEIIVLPGRGRRVYWAPSIGIVERFPESFGLVQLMDTDVRFCGFDPAPECTSIEALAGHCIELIRADQPRGPYAIVGFCQGGHAAFEIARRLVAEGESVDLVAIIDVSADGLGRSFPQQVRRLIGRARKGNGKCLFRVVAAKARLDNATDSLNAQKSRATLFNEHVEAARKYTPQRYSGRLLLIRSAELAQTEANGFYGWNELAAEVQVHTIPCRHTEMMTEPATAMIAEILRRHLAIA
jgi:thioesterase domain-containing protein